MPLIEPTFTPMQIEMWNHTAKRQFTVTGRRAGKTHLYLYELIDQAIRVPGSRVWYVGPNFPLIKPLAEQLTQELEAAGVLVHRNRQDNIWETYNRSLIQLKSADNPETLRGWDCDLVILDEASLCPEIAMFNCEIAVNIRNGRLLIGSNVPEPAHPGYDWTMALFHDWQKSDDAVTLQYPSWANIAIYPKGRDDPKIKQLEQMLPPDVFARRVGADMRVLTGLIYPEFDPQKHVIDDYKATKCCVSIDPAYRHVASVHFYDFDGRVLTVFDEVYRPGLTDPEIVELVAGYRPKPEFAVYDAADAGLGALLQQAGVPAFPSDKTNVHEGIMTVKTWFHQGRIRICRRCDKMIWELLRYAFHKSSETPIKVNDHACDDLRYLVVALDNSERRAAESADEGFVIHYPRVPIGQEV